MKICTIIGGIDGVGKSSLLGVLRAVRTDLGLVVDETEKAASERIETALKDEINFSYETTLYGEFSKELCRRARAKRLTPMAHRLFLQRTTPNCWTWNFSEKNNSTSWTRIARACRNYMVSVISRLTQQKISAKDTFLENMGRPPISKLKSCDKMLGLWQS